MVGRDSVVAASSALDGKLALNRAIIQIGESGVLCDAVAFKRLAFQHPVILSLTVMSPSAANGGVQRRPRCLRASLPMDAARLRPIRQ
jgi:hypothetical protein